MVFGRKANTILVKNLQEDKVQEATILETAKEKKRTERKRSILPMMSKKRKKLMNQLQSTFHAFKIFQLKSKRSLKKVLLKSNSSTPTFLCWPM